jgi:serine/threonine-protein kinase
MLSGAPPFRGETALSIAVQHVKTQPRPLETLRPDLPPRLCAIVHRSLEKDPVRRYASARELLRDLRSVQAEIGDTDGTNDDFWSDLGVALEGRSAGTQRLDELMKSASMQVRDDRRGYLLLLALGFVLALVVGGAIALSLRRGPLIVERSPSLQDIPKMPSARQQYGYAMFFPNSEKHLLAVAYYFPNDPFYVRISKKDLALLYLRENKLSAAADLFNEFANLSDVEGEFRAFGLAGQGVVLSLRGQHTEALQKLEESRRTGVRLESPMRELAFQAAQSSFRRLNSASKAEWESWMRDAFGEGT